MPLGSEQDIRTIEFFHTFEYLFWRQGEEKGKKMVVLPLFYFDGSFFLFWTF